MWIVGGLLVEVVCGSCRWFVGWGIKVDWVNVWAVLVVSGLCVAMVVAMVVAAVAEAVVWLIKARGSGGGVQKPRWWGGHGSRGNGGGDSWQWRWRRT